jgi:hypothetical protein
MTIIPDVEAFAGRVVSVDGLLPFFLLVFLLVFAFGTHLAEMCRIPNNI